MKTRLFAFLPGVFALFVISWGSKGHRTIAFITEKHLEPNAKTAVKALLQGESIEDAATWPDEHRTEEDAKFHFINLPAGLTRKQFDKLVTGSQGTIYSSFVQFVKTLNDPGASWQERQRALRFIIHLVGDAHQPMHVAHAKDKGGNTIQVRFDTGGTNLHALWDSKMIDQEGLSDKERVKQYDAATPAEIAQWQKDGMVTWLWESYQLSEELYKQAKPGQQISVAYYKKYIAVIRKRVNQAGIRLAGFLNQMLEVMPLPVEGPQSNDVVVADVEYIPVKLEEVAAAVGRNVKVSGVVFGTKDIGSMLLVNIGASYPNNPLTVALKGKAKEAISAEALNGKTATIYGEVILYKGKPEIIVKDSRDFTVQ